MGCVVHVYRIFVVVDLGRRQLIGIVICGGVFVCRFVV